MDTALLLGVFGGLSSLIVIVTAIFYVLLVIANWKIFKKAGEGGWKSIIPILNTYVFYKISWKRSIFWITLLGSIAVGILLRREEQGCVIIAGVIGFVVLLLNLISIFKFSRAFGHGFWFTLGLLFLPNVFTMILGFGKSKYIGPQ